MREPASAAGPRTRLGRKGFFDLPAPVNSINAAALGIRLHGEFHVTGFPVLPVWLAPPVQIRVQDRFLGLGCFPQMRVRRDLGADLAQHGVDDFLV